MTHQIKNIIFDLGGVLLKIDYRLTEKAFMNLGCKDFHSIYSQAKQTTLFDDFETGKMTEENFLNELRSISGLKNVSQKEIIAAWNAMLLDFPKDIHGLLLDLKNKYRIFLLSNTNEIHIAGFTGIIEQHCSLADFENLFEKVYYSARMGKRKPNADCFLQVLQENNLHPEETIFIDDSIQHVKGAIQTGIKARWLEQPMATENLLRGLNLI